jgi:predicted ribosomally synthesized peptide with nif11-like leader
MSEIQATAFIEHLKENESLQLELESLDEGDWDGVIKVGQTAGFEFTVEEIQAAVPESFYKGAGQNPHLGWSRDTMKK